MIVLNDNMISLTLGVEKLGFSQYSRVDVFLIFSPFLQRTLVEMMCSFFVASCTGVVKYRGPRPSMSPKQVCVIYVDCQI